MQGYIKDDHDQSCIDFDECEQGTHTCHAESQVFFSNKPFFLGITAPKVYYGRMVQCHAKFALCFKKIKKKCINIDGSYECECHPGYQKWDDSSGSTYGEQCYDIDECTASTPPPCSVGPYWANSYCVNSIGSYFCECNTGWYKNELNSYTPIAGETFCKGNGYLSL